MIPDSMGPESFVFPKWLKVLFIATILIGAVKVVYDAYNVSYKIKNKHETNPAMVNAGLSKLNPENIVSVTIILNRNDKQKRTLSGKEELITLSDILKKLKPPLTLGMRGPWTYFDEMDIDSTVGRFRIIFMTRPTLRGHVIANIQTVEPGTSYVSDYDGDYFWSWFERLPIVTGASS